MGLGWPHLSGETEEETEVALIDYNYCVSDRKSQEDKVRPIGSTEESDVDVRIGHADS